MPEFEQRSLTFAQRVDGRWWMSQVALSPEHSVRSPDAEKGRELLARRTKDTIESLAVAELYQRRWGWDYEVRCSEIVVSPPRDAVWQPVTLRFDWIAWKPGVLQLRSVVEQPQGTKKETVIDTLHQEAQQFDWQADETGAIGLALVLNGRLAYPMFEPERGLHVFRYPNQTHKCLVDIGDHKLSAYATPAGIDRRGAIGGQRCAAPTTWRMKRWTTSGSASACNRPAAGSTI